MRWDEWYRTVNKLPKDMIKISSKEIGAKMEAKNEIYRFLASECGVYLPPEDTVTIFHLKDLMGYKEKRIKSVDIKHISIPCFEGLYIKDLLKFGLQYKNVIESLPPENEIPKLPRQYIANIIFTRVGKPFQ